MEHSAFEFHIARAARDHYGFAGRLFSVTANVVVVDLAASRDLAHRMNTVRDAARHPDRLVHPGALNAMGIIDEVTHLVLSVFRERRDPLVMVDALGWLESRVGRDALDATLLAFADQFPTTAVYRGLESASDWLARETLGVPHRAIALGELTQTPTELDSPPKARRLFERRAISARRTDDASRRFRFSRSPRPSSRRTPCSR
jgi:hypothetical protein